MASDIEAKKTKGSFKFRFIGVLLLFAGLTTWLWMLGGLSYLMSLTEVNHYEVGSLAEWIKPGILFVPAVSSTIMLIAGISAFFTDKEASNSNCAGHKKLQNSNVR